MKKILVFGYFCVVVLPVAWLLYSSINSPGKTNPDDLSAELSGIRLVVDHNKTYGQLIEDGKYVWLANNRNRLPALSVENTMVVLEYKVFDFCQELTIDEAIERIKKVDPDHPWTPATAQELLVYGGYRLKHSFRPEVIALGSLPSCDHSNWVYVPNLCAAAYGRGFDLEPRDRLSRFDMTYHPHVFLAVRNINH